MKISQISYYDRFSCTGTDCPETCCRGWLIPLDAEDISRFTSEKGIFKLRLMLAMSEHSIPVFNSSCGECTFHNRDGLCSLQLKRGHSFIPEVCRSYPRFYRNYGSFEERYLDLSCIKAAAMLIQNASSLTLTVTEGPPDCEKTITNDDESFLDSLLSIRSGMQSALSGVSDLTGLAQVMKAIDTYSSAVQDACLHGDDDYASRNPFSIDRSEPVENILSDPDRIFPLSAGEIDSLAHTSLYHIRLKKTNPGLYELFDLYFNRYYRDVATENGWISMITSLTGRYPEVVSYCAAYYSYYLYQYWLRIWEDYSFVRHTRLGIIHLSMLLLLSVIYEKKHRSLTADEFAHIIAVYNRRAYFSDEFIDSMYRVLDSRIKTPFNG